MNSGIESCRRDLRNLSVRNWSAGWRDLSPQFFQWICLAKHYDMQITCNDAKHATFALNAASQHNTTSIPARIFRARQRNKRRLETAQQKTTSYINNTNNVRQISTKYDSMKTCRCLQKITYFGLFLSLCGVGLDVLKPLDEVSRFQIWVTP